MNKFDALISIFIHPNQPRGRGEVSRFAQYYVSPQAGNADRQPVVPEFEMDTRAISKFSPVQTEILGELSRALTDLGADPALFTIIGSWGDTLPDQEILGMIREFNSATAELQRQSG